MKKIRRINHMEEARKELLKIEEIKVQDYTDTVRELTGFIRENYITGLELGLHLWGENLKIINSQIDRWILVQKEYVSLIKDSLDRFPSEEFKFWNINSEFANAYIEKLISSEKDYSKVVINTSDRFVKGAFALMRKAIERIFPS